MFALSLLAIALSLLPQFVLSAAILPHGPHHEARNSSSVEKRTTEIIYICNCKRWTPLNANDWYPASYVAWYADWTFSNDGENPDAITYEYRDWSQGGSTITFEGVEQDFTWPSSGAIAYIHIASNGLNVGSGNYAGFLWRYNLGAWQQFNCYLDNYRTLFNNDVVDANGQYPYLHCNSLYWCTY